MEDDAPRLPEELRERILTLACELRDDECNHPTFRDVLDACTLPMCIPCHVRTTSCDVDTTLSVMQLNRAYFAVGAQILYRSVILHRPSQLRAFLHTLVARPVLGRLVKHLYVGSILSQSEQPLLDLIIGFGTYEQAFSIVAEVQRRPADSPCTPSGSLLSCTLERDMAEVSAMHAGPSGSGGVSLEPGTDFHGHRIPKAEWVARLCEARSLLTWLRFLAYEERMHAVQRWQTNPFNVETHMYTLRAEHPHACVKIDEYLGNDEPDDPFAPRALHRRRVGTRHDPLDWSDACDMLYALPASDDDVHTTLTWHILQSFTPTNLPRWLCVLIAKALAYGQWLALCAVSEHAPMPDAVLQPQSYKRGAPFFQHDRFDDAYVYAVSGAVSLFGLEEHGGVEDGAAMENADLWAMHHRHPFALYSSWERRPFGIALHDWQVPMDVPPSVDEYEPVPVQTLGSLIQSVHTLLAMVPHVELLGLSGVLERAIAGFRQCVELPHLTQLYVGPPPLFWAHTLQWGNPHHPTFAHVRDLHITGCTLLPSEAQALGGADGALPNLKSVTWSMYRATLEYEAATIVSTIATILGIEIPGVVRAPPAEQRRHGVRALRVVLHDKAYRDVQALAPAYIKECPRLSLCIADAQGPVHPVVKAWSHHHAHTIM